MVPQLRLDPLLEGGAPAQGLRHGDQQQAGTEGEAQQGGPEQGGAHANTLFSSGSAPMRSMTR